MEEITKLVSENYSFIEKLLREASVQVQEEYADDEELMKELKESIVDDDLFNIKLIQHPLVIGDLGSNSNSFYNKELIRKQQKLNEYEKKKNYKSYLFLIEKPFRVLFFIKLIKQNKIKKFSKKYWRILRFLWTRSENIFQHKELWKELLKDKTNSHYFMSKKDLEFYNSLENEFMVYRGYNQWEDGYSYTIDKDVAIWFAERFGQNGLIRERLVKKEDVFAFTNSREEKEIIII